jgi:hypothetical protein
VSRSPSHKSVVCMHTEHAEASLPSSRAVLDQQTSKASREATLKLVRLGIPNVLGRISRTRSASREGCCRHAIGIVARAAHWRTRGTPGQTRQPRLSVASRTCADGTRAGGGSETAKGSKSDAGKGKRRGPRARPPPRSSRAHHCPCPLRGWRSPRSRRLRRDFPWSPAPAPRERWCD